MIYVDNAATTRISDTVLEAMLPYLKDNYGNASSIYKLGRDNYQVIEKCRKNIAHKIGAFPNEIYFTSGGTESDNWAIKSVMKEAKKNGKNHLIVSSIEHHAVLNSAKSLEKEGFEVTYLSVNSKGIVDLDELKRSINERTALVSIMFANNEIGTIQPVKEIGKICHEHHVLFHSDAVQAVGILPIDVNDCFIDLLSSSAHKYHGPKGIGFLYIRRQAKIMPFFHGGAQEKGQRPGTENVANIVGMNYALNEAYEHMNEKYQYLSSLRDYIEEGLKDIPESYVNGDKDNRLPGILNISFNHIDGQSLLFELDLKGICASSGSACSSGSIEPSHVLLACGVEYALAHGTLRISLGQYNTKEEADLLIEKIKEAIEYLR